MNPTDTARRRFLLHTAAATAALPLLALLPHRNALAADLPPLPLTNAQAKALNYTEDASKTTHASHKPDSFCDNCQFYVPATKGCTIFPGFSVAPKGWCSAWALKK